MEMADSVCSFVVKWSAKEYAVEIPSSSGTVLCLKKAIEIQTGVRVERQKLLNLKYKGKCCSLCCYNNTSQEILFALSRQGCRRCCQVVFVRS